MFTITPYVDQKASAAPVVLTIGPGLVLSDATIAAGTPATLTSAAALFAAADVGGEVIVAGAGAAGAKGLVANITGFTNASTVTIGLPVGVGTVVATAGAATFSVSQTGTLANGSVVVVAGTPYTVSALAGLTCTLSGAPTFGASAFTWLGAAVSGVAARVSPRSPSNGDTWVDTSGLDTNLGNGTAGSFIPLSAADFIVRRYVSTWAKWVYTGNGGPQGTRMSVPVAYTSQRGTRVQVRVLCTAAAGRYQLEGLGLAPSTVRADS